MKLGKYERALLAEIELYQGDIFLGFLCSAGSASRMYRQAHQNKKNRLQKARKAIAEKQARKRALRRLEQKNLIKLVPVKEDYRVEPTEQGQAWARLDLIARGKNKPQPAQWDRQWTLVMFDMPTGHTSRRISFVSILKQIGFIQIQMSNYVYPYDVPEVEEFLRFNPGTGEFCQVFRGRFKGDDKKLRDKFDLK